MKKIKYLILAMFSLFVVGCASKTVEKPAEQKPQEKTVTTFEGKTLNVVATSEKYKKLFDKFTEETKAKVEFLSMSSGEVISKIKAESGKPMADVWFGGGIDAFMKAKSEGLLEMYKPQGFDKIKEGYKDNEGYWISKGVTVVGFLVNNKILEDKNLPIPKTWEELIDEKYKDEIIMANPAVSGTSFANVKGLLDIRDIGYFVPRIGELENVTASYHNKEVQMLYWTLDNVPLNEHERKNVDARIEKLRHYAESWAPATPEGEIYNVESKDDLYDAADCIQALLQVLESEYID